MITWMPKAKDLFLSAMDLPPNSDRSALLDRECGDDHVLRAEVVALLAAFDQAGSFLESPVVADADQTIDLPSLAERPGTIIGPYKLLEQIGEGGFGVVFLAEQSEPVRRKVAVKVLKPGMDSRPVVARFEAERQALAIMDHPNIAKVFDGGMTPAGRPYFVMELVKGVSITAYCEPRRLTPTQRLELFVQVCQAVQHAHQKGIIHRDLKPSNVLVTVHDTTPVPKVIDFGIAKAVGQQLTDKTLFTGFTQMIGTPMYMSPEQAGHSGLDVDTRSDIYSLGVLLYELLTGTTPFAKDRFTKAGYDEIRRIIRDEEPVRPSTRLSTLGQHAETMSTPRGHELRKLSSLFRGELDWIVMRALEKDRSRRYETVSAFAADVQRFLNNEPVQACPPTAAYRLRKFVHRNKAAVLTSAGIALGLLLAVGGALVVQAAGNQRLREEKKLTGEALDREKETNTALVQALESEELQKYLRSIALAERELVAGNVGRAEEILDDCPQRLRGWEWHHLKRRPHGPLVFREHKSGVWGVAFCPDDKLIASSSFDVPLGVVILWDRATGEVRRRINAHLMPIEGLTFSPDGKHLATASWDKTVKIWDVATGKMLHTLRGHKEYVRRVAFSRDGQFLASAGGDHNVFVWDTTNYEQTRSLVGHSTGVYSLSFGKDGRLASASSDGTVRIWDVANGRTEHVLKGHAGPALAVAFSNDGTRLASGGFDSTVRVWDPKNGTQLFVLHNESVPMTCVAFNKEGDRLIVGSLDKSVRLWDLGSRLEAVALGGHQDTAMDLAVSADGLQFASASLDGTVRIWDSSPVRTGPKSLPILGHSGTVFGVAFQPNAASLTLASGSQDESVRLWDATNGVAQRTLAGHAGPAYRVIFSRDGKRMISSDFAGVTKAWDTATFKELRTFQAFAGVVALSPDGRRVAMTAEGAQVQIRDVETGVEILAPFRAGDVPVVTLAFSPDGQQLATGGWDGEIKVWDVANGRVVRTYAGKGIINWVTFSPDGKRVAASSWNKTAMVWDTDSGQLLHTLRGHEHRLVCAEFSPDGKQIATASQDNTARIWDAETGKPLAVLHGHIGYVMCVAYSPDGKWLATSGGHRAKGDIRVWSTAQWK